VKEFRKQLAFNQKDLARELGIIYTNINLWENGQSKPSIMTKILFDAFYETRSMPANWLCPQI